LKRQQAELRPGHWDADVQALVERLKELRTAEPVPPPPAEEPSAPAGPPVATPQPATDPEPVVAAAPEGGHYEEVVRLLLEEGSVVVPFLGPGANSCDRTEPWHEGDSAYLPDADELAAYLALKLDPAAGQADLASVSQSVSWKSLKLRMTLVVFPNGVGGRSGSFLAIGSSSCCSMRRTSSGGRRRHGARSGCCCGVRWMASGCSSSPTPAGFCSPSARRATGCI